MLCKYFIDQYFKLQLFFVAEMAINKNKNDNHLTNQISNLFIPIIEWRRCPIDVLRREKIVMGAAWHFELPRKLWTKTSAHHLQCYFQTIGKLDCQNGGQRFYDEQGDQTHRIWPLKLNEEFPQHSLGYEIKFEALLQYDFFLWFLNLTNWSIFHRFNIHIPVYLYIFWKR